VKQYEKMPECFLANRDCELMKCGSDNPEACDELWRYFNEATYGNASCPYCLGGNDWTGRCVLDSIQSPVVVEWESVDTDPKVMQFFAPNYTAVTAMLVNKNNALEIRAPFGSMNYEGVEYIADSVIFRAPAEHQIQGAPKSAIEVQIVHREKYSFQTLIIAVLFDEDVNGNSVEMAKVLNAQLPTGEGDAKVITGFDLSNIIDSSKPMLWYNGSLSMPPCSQPVLWGIQMGANSHVSKDQVRNINSLWKDNPTFANGRGNNRHTQPLNGRRFFLRSNCGTTGAIACPRGTGFESQGLVEIDTGITE
jgi:carbonic anhydrase